MPAGLRLCAGDIRKHPGEWNATGTQFQIPYVFKKLFSREEIVFEDMCETKSVTTALYLDTNETLPDVSEYEKELETLRKKWPDKEGQYPMDYDEVVADLKAKIEPGHNYIFIGKVGSFCPMKPGCNGGLLLREVMDKKTGERAMPLLAGPRATVGWSPRWSSIWVRKTASTGGTTMPWWTPPLRIFPNTETSSGSYPTTPM